MKSKVSSCFFLGIISYKLLIGYISRFIFIQLHNAKASSLLFLSQSVLNFKLLSAHRKEFGTFEENKTFVVFKPR